MKAIDKLSELVGSRSAVARAVGTSPNTLFDWAHKGKRINPAMVATLTKLSRGEMPPHLFRPDVYGFLAPAFELSAARWSIDAIAAAMLLSYHQVAPEQAAAWLIANHWPRNQARKAVDELIDNGFSWLTDYVHVRRVIKRKAATAEG